VNENISCESGAKSPTAFLWEVGCKVNAKRTCNISVSEIRDAIQLAAESPNLSNADMRALLRSTLSKSTDCDAQLNDALDDAIEEFFGEE